MFCGDLIVVHVKSSFTLALWKPERHCIILIFVLEWAWFLHMSWGKKLLRLSIIMITTTDDSIFWMGKLVQLCDSLCTMISAGVCYSKSQLSLVRPERNSEHISLGD